MPCWILCDQSANIEQIFSQSSVVVPSLTAKDLGDCDDSTALQLIFCIKLYCHMHPCEGVIIVRLGDIENSYCDYCNSDIVIIATMLHWNILL